MQKFTNRLRPVPLTISIVAGCLLAPLGIGRASELSARAADQAPPVQERLQPPTRHDASVQPEALNQTGDTANLVQVSHVGGVALALALGDEHVYFGVGRRVAVASLADPQNPVLRGESDALVSVVSQMAVHANTVYAVSGSQIVILERDGQERLQFVSSIASPGRAWIGGIAVQYPFLYVALGKLGLQVVDIANPREPVQISLWDPDGSSVAGNITDVALQSKLAFLADAGVGLRIVDVTEPQRPALVGTGSRPVQQPALDAVGVAVEGKQAFLAASQAGLVIYDVDIPSRPVEQAVVPIVGANGGRYVDVTVDDQRAYAVHWVDSNTRDGGVVVVDRTRLAASPKKAHISGIPLAIAVRDNIAYLAASNGWRVADLSDPRSVARSGPDSPLETSAMRIPSGGIDLAIDGNRLASAELDSGVAILDSDPVGGLTKRSSVDRLWETRAVDFRWPLVYVASLDIGVRSIDVSGAVPEVVAQSASIKGWPLSMQVYAGNAYIAYKDGLRIIKVGSNGSLSQPQQLVFSSLSQFVVSGRLGFSVEEAMGLRTWTLSTAAPPVVTELGRFPAAAGTTMVGTDVQGNLVYVTGNGSCLRILDIADPATVRQVGELRSPCQGRRVAVNGTRAYVVGSGRVVGIDVTQPESPRLLGSLLLADVADVVMSGEDAIVTTTTDGIYTLRYVPPTPTPTVTMSATPPPSPIVTLSSTPTTISRTPPVAPSAPSARRSLLLPMLSRAALINTPPPAATLTLAPTTTLPPSATPERCAVAEAEPNDLPAKALGHPLLCAGQAIDGAIHSGSPPDSADYYTMLLGQQARVRVRMTSVSLDRGAELDLGLWACSAGGCSQVGWSGQRGNAQEMIEVTLAIGTYFVGAHPSRARAAQATYRVDWSVHP